MQAVVLATGGHGDMRPLDNSRPLYTLPIVDTTIIEYTVQQLIDLDVEKIEVRTHDRSVQHALGAGRDEDESEYDGTPITFPHQNRSLGYSLDEGENFVVLRGDVLYGEEGLEEMVDSMVAVGYHEDMTLGAHGEVIIEEGDVTRIEVGQRPTTGTYGAYAFTFPGSAQSWHESLDGMALKLVNEYNPKATLFKGWDWIRDPADLFRANMRIVQSETEDGVYIGEDTEIEGEVNSPCIILDGATVKSGAVVENSVVLDNASVGSQSYIGYSILGEKSIVEQGVHVATENTSGSNVTLEHTDGESVDTSVPFFGTVLGERARVRTGATLSEGRVIGRGDTVGLGNTL